MAPDLWNRVNVPRPGAVCTVRVPFTSSTDAKLRRVLDRNGMVLSLLRSELLQTDIRVMYELLYVLHNSLRSNQTYRGLKQVEQCINRLKMMKLDEALQEVQEFFPKNIQRKLSMEAGEGDVPSQPLLEWLCLKVLGGAQLMSLTLQRCCKAFTLSRQQMMWAEFLVLNMVITSLLSRLWTIFHGVLVSLSVLYQHLLWLLREVSGAHPMPFLTDFSLPTDMMQFLGLSDAFLLTKLEAPTPHNKQMKQEIQEWKKKNLTVQVKKQQQTKKNRVDLGVAIQRGAACHTNWKPSQKVSQDSTKVSKAKPVLHKMYMASMTKKFKRQLKKSATFTEMVARLAEIITWCQTKKMTEQGQFLSNLHNQCEELKKLEEGGHNLPVKLKGFRQQACRVFSLNWKPPKRCHSSAPRMANTHRNNHLNSLKHQLRFHLKRHDRITMKLQRRRMQLMRQRKGTEPSGKSKKRSKVSTQPSGKSKKKSKMSSQPSVKSKKQSKMSTQPSGKSKNKSKVKTKTSTHNSHNDDHDDIDDIFASAGL